jgi:hypothetical protein
MQIDPAIIFSFVAAFISVGGILITIGVLKGKIGQNDEANKTQQAQIEACATKIELNTATARADELLEIIKKRAEEDRVSGEGHYRELYGLITGQRERITAVETIQKEIDKILTEIKGDIKTGFAEVKSELKELRKQ